MRNYFDKPKQRNEQEIARDFFDEFKGRRIEIFSKSFEDKSYYIYKGFLIKKGREFIYLERGEMNKVDDKGKEKVGEFNKMALSKSIVALVNFIGD